MAVSLKPLREQVLVITGASSGIGLATAVAAGKKGAKVVLSSRSEGPLTEAVERIRQDGGEATHVVADVTREQDMHNLAEQAVRAYGRIDTWVNNAGTSIFGYLEEVTEEDHRRLFEINFWGIVHGSLTALPYLRRTGGGALINLGSVASDMAFPIQGMYCATKHAIKGYTDALRMEVEERGDPISVTLIKPAAINTPFPRHARNYMDREPKLPPPVYPPEEVARAILHAATHRERDIYVGGAARMMTAFGHQAPRAGDFIGEKFMGPQQRRDEPAEHHEGSLYAGNSTAEVHGDHPGYVMKTSAYTRARLSPLATGAAAAAVALGVAWMAGVFE